jgi:hypothetical protein
MTPFWNTAACSLVEADNVSAVHTASIIMDRPDDGGSKYLWNVDQLLRDYRQQYPTEDCHIHIRRRENLKSQIKSRHLLKSLVKNILPSPVSKSKH